MTEKSNTTDDDSTDSQPDSSELETAKAIVDEAIGRGISRRALMLAAATGVSGAALGTLGGRASAASPSDASGTVYFEQIGDQSNPVSEFYVSNQFNVSSQGQTINVDQIDDDGSGDVEFLSPVSVDKATIASTTTEKVDEYVQTSNSSTLETITFNNLDQRHYRFRLSLATGISLGGDNELYFDSDDSNGNYNYFTWGGTRNSSANKFLISTNNDTIAAIAGMIEIEKPEGQDSRVSIKPKLGFGRPNRTSDFSVSGGWTDVSFSSVTFEFPDGLRDSSRIEVFEVTH